MLAAEEGSRTSRDDWGARCLGTTLLFLLLATVSATAQPLFERELGLDSFNVRARAMQPTSDGGFIVAGVAAVDDTTDLIMPTRGLLLRIDRNGTPLWWRLFGSTQYNEFADVRQLSDGGFLACGLSDGTATGRINMKDGWLVRTDANGDTLWTRQYGTMGHDEFSGMLPIDGGRFLLFGSRDGNKTGAVSVVDTTGAYLGLREQSVIRSILDAHIAPGGYWLVGWPGGNVVRTDSSFTPRFDTTYSRYTRVRASIPTADGGLVIWGESDDSFNPTLARIDSVGRWRWNRGYSFPRLHDGRPSILRTPDGGYLFVSHEAVGNDQPLIIKTDCVGKELWRRLYDTNASLHESGYTSVAITANGDIVMVGYQYLAYRLAPPRQLQIARVDSEGYLVRPAPDRFWRHALYTGETCFGLTVDSIGTILVGEFSNTGRALLLRSTDDGASWSNNDGPGYRYHSLTTASDGTIFGVRATDWGLPVADSTQGLWRSTDRGSGWIRVASLPSLNVSKVLAGTNRQLYVLGSGVLWRSIDAGASWDSVDVPRTAVDLAIATGGELVLANDSLGVLLSTDRGTTWRGAAPAALAGARPRLFTVLARGNGEVFALTISNDATFHTTNDGATWRRIDSAAGLKIGALASVRGVLYAQAANGTWRSPDNGASWERVSDTTFGIARFALKPDGHLVGAGRGIYISRETTVGVDDIVLPDAMDLSAVDERHRRERAARRGQE